MLTAKSSESDKINALERGADDYITKPFSPAELIARIKALLRRIRPAFSGKMLAFEDIKMELLSHTVTRQGIELELSPIEFNILLVLMENPGRVLSRETLMSKVWGNDIYVGSRTIDVHITRLRKTLMNASKDGQDIIKTVRLEGYTLRIPSKKAA
jgi:two-component system phosphate regulon response regulator PhoB